MIAARPTWNRAILLVPAAILIAFLVLPLVALVASGSYPDVLALVLHPETRLALGLSLGTTLISVALFVLFGTPLAFLLSRSSGRASKSIETLLQLPVVLPPAVAGVALLSTFGRQGLLAKWWGWEDLSLSFSTTAVVMAELFVAGPLYVQSATSAFSLIDEGMIDLARTMGASPLRIFARIAFPLARPSLVAAAGLGAARALGEFGATLMFAGNLPGTTQTLPLSIYTALETDFDRARGLSLLLLFVSALSLVLSRTLFSKRKSETQRRLSPNRAAP